MKGIEELNIKTQGLLAEGKMLPVMEAFYTIQGEGFNAGMPSYFVRIGGCDVGCSWCDVKESWNALLHPPVEMDGVIAQVLECNAKAVVVTGGEPSNYNLKYFTDKVREGGFKTYIETSGVAHLTGDWDWICLSPKITKKPLEEIFPRASELKVIIQTAEDFKWAEINAAKVGEDCMLYLQPEWSQSEKMMQQIVDYALENPKWKVSIQSHKYMHIP